MEIFRRISITRMQEDITFLNRLVALLFFVTICHVGWPWIKLLYDWLFESQIAVVILPLALLYFGVAGWVWWACRGDYEFKTTKEKLKEKEDRKEEETIEAK